MALAAFAEGGGVVAGGGGGADFGADKQQREIFCMVMARRYSMVRRSRNG